MLSTSKGNRRNTVSAVLAPLPVIATASIWAWPWWVALVVVLAVVAVVAEVMGTYRGALTALFGTAGMALLVGGNDTDANPHNGIELLAMAALLLVAVVFGTNRPPTS